MDTVTQSDRWHTDPIRHHDMSQKSCGKDVTAPVENFLGVVQEGVRVSICVIASTFQLSEVYAHHGESGAAHEDPILPH
jgi:hypothetical protein